MSLDTMQFEPRCKIGLMRIFVRLIASDVVVTAKGCNLRLPLIPALVERYSRAYSSVFSGVLHVFVLTNSAKIYPSIVRPNAVDVIDLTCWERTSHVEKSKSMLPDGSTIDNRISIPIAGVDTASNGPGEPSFSADSARKNASLGIVVQKFAQSLRSKIGLSHEAVLSLIGQRLAGAVNTARASLFSRMRQACAMGAA